MIIYNLMTHLSETKVKMIVSCVNDRQSFIVYHDRVVIKSCRINHGPKNTKNKRLFFHPLLYFYFCVVTGPI